MKASELRIGNLIYADSKLRYVFGTIYKTIQHNYHSKNSTYSENYENECEPIPLNEEWLLNFGFVLNGFSMIKGEFDVEIWLESEIGHTFKWNDFVISISLKYVHQLQNLYFALTGEELIINK